MLPRLRFCAVVLVGVALAPAIGRAEAPPKGQRVFSAGHSFHVFMPPLLTEIAQQAGIKDHEQIGLQSIGGSTTSQHWDLADEKNKAKQALNTGKVEVLTLSPHLKMPDPGIDNFVKLAVEKNPATRIYLQMSWMPFDDPANFITKKFVNEDRNKAKIADLEKAGVSWLKAMREQVETLNKGFDRPHVFVVPVGYAVIKLREKVVEGKAPGIQNQADLFTDPIGHAKGPVRALNAYCHFAAIYGKSPVGLPVPSVLKGHEKAEELTKLLQELAWEAVLAEPLSGVKQGGK